MAMVLFVVSMASLTSCQKDYSSLIIGKWEFQYVEATFNGQTFQLDVDDLASMVGMQIDSDELILEFKNNGYVYADGDGTPYKVDGSKLTITAEDQTMEFEITQLTSSKLTLEFHNDEVGMDMVMYLKRV